MIAPRVTSEQQVIVQNDPTPACSSERDHWGIRPLAVCYVSDASVNMCTDLKPLSVCVDVTSLSVCVDVTSLSVCVTNMTPLSVCVDVTSLSVRVTNMTSLLVSVADVTLL